MAKYILGEEQAETERLAGDLGMTADALLARRKGQALNAEEALAARQILAKSGNELVSAAKKIQRLDDPGDEVEELARRALEKTARVYYFDPSTRRTKDISELDPGSDDASMSGWGGLTEFSGRIADVVAEVVSSPRRSTGS